MGTRAQLFSRRLPYLLVWSGLCASRVDGQAGGAPPKRVLLSPPSVEFANGFERLISARELGDGRVLLVDERANTVSVADFSSGQIHHISRIGSGPGEYRQVGRLWALEGDSTIMADRQNARWLVFSGSSVVATLPPDSPASRGASGGGRMLSGVARTGHALGRSYLATRVEDGSIVELNHLELVRFHRAVAGYDTMHRVSESDKFVSSAQPLTRRGSQPGRGRPRTYAMPLAAQDDAVMFPDGWIAIARTDPFQVEWCSPTNQCTPGPVLSDAPPQMTDGHRRAIMRRMAWLTGWPPTSRLNETSGWPKFVPPFIRPNLRDGSALLPMPDGRLLIHRTPGPDQQARYDIIDRQGVRVAEIRLPLNQQILGFGPQSVYVVSADEDGLQFLSRHPWP